jgi:hypothetical protein
VHIAGLELGSRTVAVPVEQQQREVRGRFEMPIVGALFLRTLHRNLRRIHVQDRRYPSQGLRVRPQEERLVRQSVNCLQPIAPPEAFASCQCLVVPRHAGARLRIRSGDCWWRSHDSARSTTTDSNPYLGKINCSP